MSPAGPTAIRLILTGRVQGLGVRPAISRWARQLSLTGWVGNTCQGVEVVVEGAAGAVEQFTRDLASQLPTAAIIERQACSAVSRPHCQSFEIRRESAAGLLQARVPQDLVACESCITEVMSDSGRRSHYPFVSCTECGPRYSIIEEMPYERDRTAMRAFAMCSECQREYESLGDRRFHAQTNACPNCGPRLWCRDRSGRVVSHQNAAMLAAAQAILRGEIVAIQGLGGYQLAVDATSEEAVRRLRAAKRRDGKPLAVMAASIEEARRLAYCDDAESQSLRSMAGPIVILRQRAVNGIAAAVSPGFDTLGLMLPTTPLHALLVKECSRPLVVTSGNREGEPLEFEHDGAASRLSGIADWWLEHDRAIRRPVDDSVVRVIAGNVAVLRLGRGLAPLPLELQLPTLTPLLAIGGHQKAAIALSNGQQSILGAHLGDLDSVAERERWESQVARWLGLFDSVPAIVVGDQHPDYASTRWAAEQPRPFVQVQHHHAHVVAGMIEHHWLDRTVLGVAFDGTGFGEDGTVWGGEFLSVSPGGFRRVGHLLPFQLPGGERAIREPWRIAVSLVQRAAGSELAAALSFHAGKARDLLPFIDNPAFSAATSSAGRLFDGIAALVLAVEIAQFEGQGPMLLEALCDRSVADSYSLPVSNGPPYVLDWRQAVVQILNDLRVGVPASAIAMRFHRGLAHGIFEVARRFPQHPVVLCGGCFQNRLLVELLVELFGTTTQRVGTPGLIPVNDGGLAAGQLAIAMNQRILQQDHR